MVRNRLNTVLTGVGALAGLLLVSIIAALSGLTTTIIFAGGLYFLGFITMGTAQAIFLWLTVGVGAIVFVGGLILYAILGLLSMRQ